MKLFPFALMFLCFNACAASTGGGHVVGNPMMPASEGKEAVKFMNKKECVCQDPKATPPCECKAEEKKGAGEEEKAPDVKPVLKPKKK